MSSFVTSLQSLDVPSLSASLNQAQADQALHEQQLAHHHGDKRNSASLNRLPSALLQSTLRELQSQQQKRSHSVSAASEEDREVVVLSCATPATKGEAVMDCLTISDRKSVV